MIEKTAFIWSVNEAWAMLAAFGLLGALVVPFAWQTAKVDRLGTIDHENLQFARRTSAFSRKKPWQNANGSKNSLAGKKKASSIAGSSGRAEGAIVQKMHVLRSLNTR
jgi:hypothetical protein